MTNGEQGSLYKWVDGERSRHDLAQPEPKKRRGARLTHSSRRLAAYTEDLQEPARTGQTRWDCYTLHQASTLNADEYMFHPKAPTGTPSVTSSSAESTTTYAGI
jgi:hypothetical protein